MKQIHHNGFTLIEMLVVIGVSTVVMLAVMFGIAQLYEVNAYSFAQSTEVDNARRGVTQWNRDAKEMVVAEDGTFPVVRIEDHRFGYFSDTDLDASVEYVEYELTDTTLRKHVYDATGYPPVYDLSTPDRTEIISLYVQNINQGTSTFLYYDNAGNLLNSSSPIIDVRLIKMQLIINIDPLRTPGEFMLRSAVAPRNLKDNL